MATYRIAIGATGSHYTASHTSSSGRAASASTLTRTGAVCLDTTSARVVLSLAHFLLMYQSKIVRDNRVYHALFYTPRTR